MIIKTHRVHYLHNRRNLFRIKILIKLQFSRASLQLSAKNYLDPTSYLINRYKDPTLQRRISLLKVMIGYPYPGLCVSQLSTAAFLQRGNTGLGVSISASIEYKPLYTLGDFTVLSV